MSTLGILLTAPVPPGTLPFRGNLRVVGKQLAFVVQFSVFLLGEIRYMFTKVFVVAVVVVFNEIIDGSALDSVVFANEKVPKIVLPLLPVSVIVTS